MLTLSGPVSVANFQAVLRTLTYVNAGHNPPFLLRANGKVEALNSTGPVLGPTPDATYTRGFAKLETGDLLQYTDVIGGCFAEPVTGANSFVVKVSLSTSAAAIVTIAR